MRKTLLLTFCVGFCLLLAACGAESAVPSPSPTTAAPSPAPTPAPTEELTLSRNWDPERWQETDPVFDPAPADIPDNWVCRQAIYEVWEDGTQYGQFVWLDENGLRCRVANYIGDFCSYQKDYDEKGRPVRSVGYNHKTGLVSERTKYSYTDEDAMEYDRMVQNRYDEQGRVTQSVTNAFIEGFWRTETLNLAYDENGEMQKESEVLILSDGDTAWHRTRSWETQHTVTAYYLNGIEQRVCTQETDGNLTRTEMRDADGNLLYAQELSHTEDGATAKTVKETTVPDSDMVIHWELSVGEDGSGTSSIRLNGVTLNELGAEAHISRDDLTGEERWCIFRDGKVWLEVFWKPDPLEKDGLFPYEVICRYWDPVTVAEDAEWTEAWQERIPLTDGELYFKDYAAVWAQLSDSERKNPWSEIPYEVEGLGFVSGNSLFDDPVSALNVHPAGWCVPEGGSMTESILPLIGLVQCTLPTAQQTDVLQGEIIEPWPLLNYRWTYWDEESGTNKSISISVKPGAFDYDPDPNRYADLSYDVGRVDLNDPGTAAHVFVGDMDSRIGRAKLAIRTEDGRCHVSMVLDETGYWVDTFGLTQEEVTALLLSIVNSAPESSANSWVRTVLRDAAEFDLLWTDTASD